MAVERMKLSRLGAFYRRGGALALFPLVLALALYVGWRITSGEIRLLQNDGESATATVVSKEWRTRGTGARSTRIYHVSVAFSDLSDRRVEKSAEVRSSFYSGVREGDEIDIRYVPGESLLEIDPEMRETGAFWLAQVALLMLVWCAGMIWHYGRESAKTYRAVNFGEVREARVTGHVDDHIGMDDSKKEKDRRYMLKWDDARDQFGMGGKLKKDELEKYPVGSVIVIYTDPVSKETFWEGQI